MPGLDIHGIVCTAGVRCNRRPGGAIVGRGGLGWGVGGKTAIARMHSMHITTSGIFKAQVPRSTPNTGIMWAKMRARYDHDLHVQNPRKARRA
jgi:hypothetical protein